MTNYIVYMRDELYLEIQSENIAEAVEQLIHLHQIHPREVICIKEKC